MNTITTRDGVQIFYKDWERGQPIVYHHGWPLSSDDWDSQMLFFLQHGYWVVAFDRRGHGRSTQVADGHDMGHYAADAGVVIEHLDPPNAIPYWALHRRRCSCALCRAAWQRQGREGGADVRCAADHGEDAE